MPGMTANLTDAAYAIWDGIPNKRKGVHPGRSAWISSVIIEHAGWQERYDTLLREGPEELRNLTKLYIMRGTQLETMTASRDKLQQIVLELTE